MKVIKTSSQEWNKIINRNLVTSDHLRERVKKIIGDVRIYGDDAITKYTKKFDKVKILSKNLKVSQNEISAAYNSIDPNFVSTLKIIIENVTKFYRKQIKHPWKMKDSDGIVLGEIFNPLDKVGIYIPSGTAPLFSTVYMTVLPAQIAGVKRIILTTPPGKDGFVNPYILVVSDLLKVNEIYKVGGAQSIAALAFGTKTIPKVDKIFGPGNRFVTEAKRQLFGYCDIDMLAGPSEVVVIANNFSPQNFVLADLFSQAEHAGGLAVLITTSKSLIKHLKGKIDSGYAIFAKNLDEAIKIANDIAPEHLQILIKTIPSSLIKKVKNAGAIFLGPYSPVCIGDYIAGPSHVLPTGGTARFFSALNIQDFMKSSHIISYSKKALEKIREPLEKLACIEGLPKHLQSVKERFL
ncbi:MAG: histidinol dehydrogenase [Candidatus Omnitrophota bacterium]